MRDAVYTGRILGGRYSVGELLGQGGWGAVYAASQNDLGRKVAIKILHTDVALAGDGLARFAREARSAAALGHPNIAQVTDFQSNAGEPPFIVMEYLTGHTLGEFLRRTPRLPPSRICAIAHQVLSALDVAHRAGIVHRDVKPDNIFLVSMAGIDDFVKLLDFGIAKLSSENTAQLTDAGTMLGSPAFMAPEQVSNANVDPRADLYALGATMYFAMMGRLPFDAASMPALLYAIMEQRPTPILSIDPQFDPRLAGVIERAMHKDPAGRFASAAEMRAALEPWALATPRPGMTPSNHGAASPFTNPAMTPANHGGPSPLAGPTPHVASMPNSPYPYPSHPHPHPPQPAHPQYASQPSYPSYPAQPTPPPMFAVPPAAPTPAPRSGAVVGLLVAIVALLLVLGGGGAAAFVFLSRSPPEPTPAIVADAAATVAVLPTNAPGATTVVAPVVSSAPSATASGAKKGAAPSPSPSPTPTPSPSPAPPDAGARKQMAGTDPRVSGGTFEHYDIAASRASLEKLLPAIRACYVATEFDAPDHQFTNWTFSVDPAGNVKSVRRTTDYQLHPKFDACMIGALRQVKWPASPSGGNPQISFSARTRDNP